MIIAYGDVKEATWTLDAQGDIRTLNVTNGRGKEEELQFRLDDDLSVSYTHLRAHET